MRTIAYIDGFNLYYGSVKDTPYKWLDLCQLFRNTLPPGCELLKVKYFTAPVSALPHDPDAPIHQDIYLRALRAHLGPSIEIIQGHFSVKKVWAPSADDPTKLHRIIKTEEKGSDVNLAVELVNDAWSDAFDCAAVVSNDGDLERALKITKQTKRKKVFLYTPGAPKRSPIASLTRWAHKKFPITEAVVAGAQLPNPIPGTALAKPTSW